MITFQKTLKVCINMNEAAALNISYISINQFAKNVDKETNLSKIFNIEDIIKHMGGMIHYINAVEFKKSKFIKIFSVGKFEICLIEGMDNTLKRLLLIQALGHYMLHGNSGKEVCFISSASTSEASQEGFWFSLCVLICDEVFLKIYNTLDEKSLANLFRVPEFAIQAKKKIINQFYLNKEIV